MGFLDDGNQEMDCTPPLRIDPPNAATLGPVSQRRRGVGAGVDGSLSRPAAHFEPATEGSQSPELDRDQWLTLHSADLIRRLQAWSDELDARESQLNARASMQDNRERRFRLQRQDVSAHQDEQRRSIERLRAEVETQARQLVFRDSCSP